MRFSVKKAEYGETRTVSWFAWWPVTINHQTRWMERVTVLQEYCEVSMMGEPPHGRGSWENTAFVDPPPPSLTITTPRKDSK